MRLIAAPLVSLLALGSAAFADPVPVCLQDTLNTYIGLGNGCTIGDKLFSNFTYASTAGGGGSAVPASAVTVTPLDPSTLDPGIEFAASWSASNGQFVDSTLRFTVTVLDPQFKIDGASLAITDSESGVANGSVSETLTPPNVTLFATLGGQTSVTTFFAPVSQVTVLKDILVATSPDTPSSPNNSATLSTVTQHFIQVPEPSAIVLLAPALLAFRLCRRNAA